MEVHGIYIIIDSLFIVTTMHYRDRIYMAVLKITFNDKNLRLLVVIVYIIYYIIIEHQISSDCKTNKQTKIKMKRDYICTI